MSWPYLAHAHEGVVGAAVPESDVGRVAAVGGQDLPQRLGLAPADEDAAPARVHQARGASAPRGELGARDGVGAEAVPEERLGEEPGRGREHDAPPGARGEDAPGRRVHVGGVEPGEHGARRGLDVADTGARRGTEHQHAQARGLRRQEAQQGGQRGEEQEEEQAWHAAGLEGHQRVVRERAAGPEQRAVKVRHHGGVRAEARGVALVHRRERLHSGGNHSLHRLLHAGRRDGWLAAICCGTRVCGGSELSLTLSLSRTAHCARRASSSSNWLCSRGHVYIGGWRGARARVCGEVDRYGWLVSGRDGLSFPFLPCLVRKNFQDSPSHRIFGRMHGALNIDKNKN